MGAVVRPMNLRCICEDRDLGEVLEIAKKKNWTTAEAVASGTGCGGNCRTCRPYIARMLATGRVPTVDDLMGPEELARWRDE
jgi:NAD(P)H-nitrite reductase large subunit